MSLVPADEQAGILQALGFNPRDPKVQALALVAARYNLDLILKHVFLIQGTVYVSHAGLLHLAHTSGDLDGIEVEIVEEPTKWVATARIYRKSMSRPFTYTDECMKNEKVMSTRKRAITRAERNALRRAFDVGVDVYDGDDRREEPVVLSSARPEIVGAGPTALGLGAGPSEGADPAPTPTLGPGQSVVVRCREMGLSDDDRHELAWEASDFRTRSTKELTAREAGRAHKYLHQLETTGEKPWPTIGRTPTSPSSSPPSGPSAAKTTSATETPDGGAA